MWVCWFHLTGLVHPNPTLAPILATGRYGYMGVQIFFVVSGFVIPYALQRSGYEPTQFSTFLKKRLLRLHPPYLTIVAVLSASRAIANATGLGNFELTWPQVLAHVAYLNPFLGLPWLLDSFWTLAVEFQYYVAIGLLFPVIARRGGPTAVVSALTSGTLALLLPSGDFLPHHLPFFAMGIAAFRKLALKAPLTETLTVLAISAMFGRITYGPIAASIGLATALLILFTTYTNRALDTLGDLSYSLYLTHPLLASIVLTLSPNETIFLLTAVPAAVLGAWPLYHFVEIPSKRWSASLRYHSQTQA